MGICRQSRCPYLPSKSLLAATDYSERPVVAELSSQSQLPTLRVHKILKALAQLTALLFNKSKEGGRFRLDKNQVIG